MKRLNTQLSTDGVFRLLKKTENKLDVTIFEFIEEGDAFFDNNETEKIFYDVKRDWSYPIGVALAE